MSRDGCPLVKDEKILRNFDQMFVNSTRLALKAFDNETVFMSEISRREQEGKEKQLI